MYTISSPRHSALFAVLLNVSIFISPAASAELITGVTIHDVSSSLAHIGEADLFDRMASYTVDGSGLNINGPGTHSCGPDGTMWLNGGINYAYGYNDTDPQITWDLGALYNIDTMRIWNYNEWSGVAGLLTARGIHTTDVLYSADGTNYTLLNNITLNQAPGSDTVDFSQVVPLNLEAEFIRFHNITDFPGADTGFVGLSEIQFNGTAVPEPSILALIGMGAFALIIYAWQQRRR